MAQPASHASAHLRRLFLEGFSVREVAEPLLSVDAERGAKEVRALLEARDFDLVGVRRDGYVVGFAARERLVGGTCGDHLEAFGPGDVVDDATPLRDAILCLDNGRCVVTVLGQPSAIVTRADLEKPAVRMWLFGTITLLEGAFTRRLRQAFGESGWEAHVAPARLEKARALLAERQRRGQPGALLDCLQLGDKGQALVSAGLLQLAEGSGPPSNKAAKRQLAALEALRNNLAHAQPIIPSGWDTILTVAGRLDGILARDERSRS